MREFRDHAPSYLAGSEPIAVSNRGTVIGFYIPLPRDAEEIQHAVKRLGARVKEILADTGMSEEQLAELFGLRSPQS